MDKKVTKQNLVSFFKAVEERQQYIDIIQNYYYKNLSYPHFTHCFGHVISVEAVDIDDSNIDIFLLLSNHGSDKFESHRLSYNLTSECRYGVRSGHINIVNKNCEDRWYQSTMLRRKRDI